MSMEVTDKNFQEEVINNKELVLVDFYATWCSPCKIIGRTIEELSAEYEGKLKVCKGDVEVNNDALKKFGITGVPAILLFKKGQLVDQHVGLRSKKDLKRDIEEIFNEED